MREAHRNARRVADAATAAGLPIEIRHVPEGARTAADAAAAIGCEVAQIVKSLVFMADGEPVVTLLAGDDRLDPARLADVLDAREVRRANGAEARAATGFPIGGVPPLGYERDLTVLIDDGLLGHEVVWAAAGLPDAVFAAEPAALGRAAGARTVHVAEERRAG
jgi:prolyl-tRNA editing enzyme YbaK/EbsC (Cys-tRNA(Pro) deacylase)